jgi:hypothetical protein
MLALSLAALLLCAASIPRVSAYLNPNNKHRSADSATVDCHDWPAPMSFHVHITYMLTNDDQIQRAGELRSLALENFADLLGSDPG